MTNARARAAHVCASFATVLLSGFATVAATAQPATRAVEADDIVRFRTITSVAVTPDATRAVAAVREADEASHRFVTHLWLMTLDGAAPARQLTFGETGESRPHVFPDASRVAFLAKRGASATSQVWALPIAGGEARPLTAHAPGVSAFGVAPDGRRLYVLGAAPETASETERKKRRDDAYSSGRQWSNDRLWIVDVESGTATAVSDGSRHVSHAEWSPDSKRIALITTPSPEADASEDATLQVVDVATRAVTEVPDSLQASALAWSPDGSSLAYVRPFDGRGLSRADVFVWTPGAQPRNVSKGLDRDAERIDWSPEGRLHVLYSRGASSRVATIDVASARIVQEMAPGFPVGALEPAAATWVYVRNDRPAELYTAARLGEAERQLTRLNPLADAVALPRIETLSWKGALGDVEGILTLPAGSSTAGPRPLIVRPHGGPRGHDQADFDPVNAFFTGRGFAVLQPNFRGSTGYGDAFTRGNVANWGDGPYRDMMAGVEVVVRRGIADARRLFIYGWSYGGYLTNWAITHGAPFRAAASGAGVADLRMQYSISDARRWRFDYFKGSPFVGHWPLYEQQSPITSVRSAGVPTLFLHGEADVRCPLPQGLMMHRGLKDVGIETELVVYPREGHTFSEPQHVIDRARRVVEWFARFDRPAS